VPYLSASAVVIHYKEALYQVYAPLPLPSLPVLHVVTPIATLTTPVLNWMQLCLSPESCRKQRFCSVLTNTDKFWF